MELSDEAKAEIKAAIAILKSDGVHIHKTYERYHKTKETADPPTDPKTQPPKDAPTPPPTKDPATDPPAEPPKKAGLWWGTKED